MDEPNAKAYQTPEKGHQTYPDSWGDLLQDQITGYRPAHRYVKYITGFIDLGVTDAAM
jgi:hypothetical protein